MKHIEGVAKTMIVIGENAVMQINLPKIFPTMSEHDTCRVAEWYVHENDVIEPEQLLVEIDAAYGLIAIPAPPDVKVPYRVVRLGPQVGSEIRLGEFLIALEPVEQ
jgi:hypothetical protein